MEVKEILEVMEEMLDGAPTVPLSGGKCLIETERLRELITDIRENLPIELESAKQTLSERQRMLADANEKASSIVKAAEDRARRMVDEDAITRQVKEQAKEMMMLAMNQSKELKNAANEYADRTLKAAEQGLVDSINQLRTAKAALRAMPQNDASAKPQAPNNAKQ